MLAQNIFIITNFYWMFWIHDVFHYTVASLVVLYWSSELQYGWWSHCKVKNVMFLMILCKYSSFAFFSVLWEFVQVILAQNIHVITLTLDMKLPTLGWSKLYFTSTHLRKFLVQRKSILCLLLFRKIPSLSESLWHCNTDRVWWYIRSFTQVLIFVY